MWNALLPKFVHNVTSFDRALKVITEKNMKPAVETGFEEVHKG
jgi:hypothetical protein